MRITPAVVGRVVLIVLAAIFAFYVWPTPYREYRFNDGNRIIQVNRFTGDSHVLFDNPH